MNNFNRNYNINKGSNKMNKEVLVGGGIVGLFGLMILSGTFQIVSPGERGVKITLGKAQETVLDEGLHLKLPFVTSIKTISVRIQKTESQAEAATKDLQLVNAKVALNWHLDAKTVSKMYKEIGDETAIHSKIIDPAVSEVLKTATAKLTAEEVLVKRMELKKTIDELLIERLSHYDVIVKDISLVDLSFSQNFNHAVEEKQIAEQKAKQAEYDSQRVAQEAKSAVNKAKGEAESTLVKARAQAESQKLLIATLTPEILQMEMIRKWSGVLPVVVTGNGGNTLLDINKLLNNKKDKE